MRALRSQSDAVTFRTSKALRAKYNSADYILRKLLECDESSRRFGAFVAVLCERRDLAKTRRAGGPRPPLQLFGINKISLKLREN